MKIAELNPKDELSFNKLALAHGTIFNTIEWVNIFNNQANLYGIYNGGSELIGGFVIFKNKKCGLSIYRNPPSTPIGPFLKVEASNPVRVMDTWKDCLSLISNFIEDLPYAVVSFSLNRNIIDMQPFIWKKFKVIPGYTYQLDLKSPVENIWRRMSSDRRKSINKAKKDGLVVKNITDLGVIETLVLKTFSRQGIRINESYLGKVLFQFANQDNSFAYAAYKGNLPIAASFCIHDMNTAFYLLGGYDSERKHHGAGALAMWEAIKYAKTIGLGCFDLEGSMVPQIEKYFRGFGGRLTQYYRINKAKLPIEMMLKFAKREFF